MNKRQWAGWVCMLGMALTAKAYEVAMAESAGPVSPDMATHVSSSAEVKPLPEKDGMRGVPEEKKILSAVEAPVLGTEGKFTDEGDGTSWFANRLVVGTRITSYGLKEKERPLNNRYLGSINKIDEDQDYMPTKIFLNYFPVPWGGVGVSYEKIRAVTITDWKAGVGAYSDGTFEVDGPIFYGILALTNRTRVTPFVELGMMIPSGSFEANSAWANAHGIQGYQNLVVQDVHGGEEWAVGCDIRIKEGWSCNLIYREITAEMIVDHVLQGSVNEQNSNRSFDISSRFVGGGISYHF